MFWVKKCGVRVVQGPQHAADSPIAELLRVEFPAVNMLPLQQSPNFGHALELRRQLLQGCVRCRLAVGATPATSNCYHQRGPKNKTKSDYPMHLRFNHECGLHEEAVTDMGP